MERYRDVAVVYEEYNYYQISDMKFQALKSAVYNGEGNLSFEKPPDTLHQSFSMILVAMGNPAALDFSCTFIVAGLESCS